MELQLEPGRTPIGQHPFRQGPRLEHAVDLGWINYPLLAEKEPFLAGLRGTERFARLMERVRREWEGAEG